MFGISPLGWVHTLASLPAIPAAIYMFARHGRIVPRSPAGALYLVTMAIGGLTAFAVAKSPVSPVIAALTLVALAVGYGIAGVTTPGRLRDYVETFSLSFSALLLMVPTVTETLTRVPDGSPFAASPEAPLVVAAQGVVFVVFLLGVALQMLRIRRAYRGA